MGTVGIVRKLDELGRLTIPSEYRTQFNLADRASVEVIGTQDGILVRPYKPALSCSLCGTPGEHHWQIKGQRVCAKCVAVLEAQRNKLAEKGGEPHVWGHLQVRYPEGEP